MNKKSLISIDILRFLAAFSVFWYHNHIGSVLAGLTSISALRYTDNLGSTYAVPLFFLISGFCIHLSNLSKVKDQKPLGLKVYLYKRLKRIYPPYLIALIVSIIINAITGYEKMPSFNDFLVHLFALQGYSTPFFNSINLVLWTISVEISFYLLYPFFYYLILKSNINTALAVVFIVSLLSIISISFLFQDITPPLRFFVLNLWFSWCAGAFFCHHLYSKDDFYSDKTWKAVCLLIVGIFIMFNFFIKNDNVFLKDNINVLIFIPVLYAFIKAESLFVKYKTIFKIPVLLGVSSYSLYLLHEPLISLKNYLVHEYLPLSLQKAFVLVGIMIIPVLTHISYMLFEKPFIGSKSKALKIKQVE